MQLIEKIPMPGYSSKSIEEIIQKYLKMYIPSHLENPSAVDTDELWKAIYNSHKYKMCLVEKHDDPSIEAQVNFWSKEIQITEEFMRKLEDGDERSKFTLAHEISHVIFHSSYIMSNLQQAARAMTSRPQKIETYESSEWQAEHSAGALLMPACSFVPYYKSLKQNNYSYMEIVESIVVTFGVSNSASESRIRALERQGLIYSNKKRS